MSVELILRYLHFSSIFLLFSMLVLEHFLLKPALTRGKIAQLAKVDGVYGMASITLLAVGLTLWLGSYGKPSSFYSQNWIFLTKLGLFAGIGLLSIVPTMFFLKNRKGNPDEEVQVPSRILYMIKAELVLVGIIPLLAGLMAKGNGYMG
jgi:putative membrane protein